MDGAISDSDRSLCCLYHYVDDCRFQEPPGKVCDSAFRTDQGWSLDSGRRNHDYKGKAVGAQSDGLQSQQQAIEFD